MDFEKLLSHTHHGLSRLRRGPSGNANGDLNRPSKADSSGTYPVHEVDKSLEVVVGVVVVVVVDVIVVGGVVVAIGVVVVGVVVFVVCGV